MFYSYVLDAERPEAQGLSKAGERAWGWVTRRRRFDGDGDFSAVSKEHPGQRVFLAFVSDPGRWVAEPDRCPWQCERDPSLW